MTTKKIGRIADFQLKRDEQTRVVICYDYTEINETDATWREVELNKRQHQIVDFELVRNAILADINQRTDERILTGYEWTLLHGDETLPKKQRRIGETVNVWLSNENQTNYKAKYDLHYQKPEALTFPCVYKIGEQEGEAIFETFQTFDELEQFYLGGIAWIEQQVNIGWAEKKAIDWTPYQALFPQQSGEGTQESAE